MVTINKPFRKIIQDRSRCLRWYLLLQQLSLELERSLLLRYKYTKYCLFKATCDSESTISKDDISNDSMITKILKSSSILS